MTMFLMGNKKLLNLLLQAFLLRGFLKFSFLFTIVYLLGVKKHTLFNKFLLQKIITFLPLYLASPSSCQIGCLFACYSLDIYFSLNSIIH